MQREKSLLVNAMPDIFEITDSLTSLFPDEVFPDVEDMERNHSELLRRISHRLSELGIETKSKSSHKSKFTSNRSRLSSRALTMSSKSIRLEAAAKAAEMAIRLKYHEKETNAERIKMEREAVTEKNPY